MNNLLTPSVDAARELAAKAGDAVDQAAYSAGHLADAAKADIDHLLATAPGSIKGALQRSVGEAGALTQRGIERAREASASVGKQVSRAGDCTVSYIQQQPVKSVLMGVALGAAGAALIGWMARSRVAR